jgi:hypothetical protein
MNNEVPIIYPIFSKIIYKKNLSSFKDKELLFLKKECNKIKYTTVPKEDLKILLNLQLIDIYLIIKNLKI